MRAAPFAPARPVALGQGTRPAVGAGPLPSHCCTVLLPRGSLRVVSVAMSHATQSSFKAHVRTRTRTQTCTHTRHIQQTVAASEAGEASVDAGDDAAASSDTVDSTNDAESTDAPKEVASCCVVHGIGIDAWRCIPWQTGCGTRCKGQRRVGADIVAENFAGTHAPHTCTHVSRRTRTHTYRPHTHTRIDACVHTGRTHHRAPAPCTLLHRACSCTAYY